MPRPKGRPNTSRAKTSASAGKPRGRPRSDEKSRISFQPRIRQGSVDIYWIGHSSFRIHSVTRGKSVITDPFAISKKRINLISGFTVSHFKDHHSTIPDYASGVRVFKSPGEYEYDGFTIRSVMSPLSLGMNRADRNVVHNITVDGFSVCHLGNIVEPLTLQHMEMIGPADVVLMPYNDDETLSYFDVVKMARQLESKIIIPMHYPKDQLSTQFLVDAGLAKDKIESKNKLRLSAGTMPHDLKVEILEPQQNKFLFGQSRENPMQPSVFEQKQDTLSVGLQSIFRF